jgi:hypothetical protein
MDDTEDKAHPEARLAPARWLDALEKSVLPRLLELRRSYYQRYGRPNFATEDFDDAVDSLKRVIAEIRSASNVVLSDGGDKTKPEE